MPVDLTCQTKQKNCLNWYFWPYSLDFTNSHRQWVLCGIHFGTVLSYSLWVFCLCAWICRNIRSLRWSCCLRASFCTSEELYRRAPSNCWIKYTTQVLLLYCVEHSRVKLPPRMLHRCFGWHWMWGIMGYVVMCCSCILRHAPSHQCSRPIWKIWQHTIYRIERKVECKKNSKNMQYIKKKKDKVCKIRLIQMQVQSRIHFSGFLFMWSGSSSCSNHQSINQSNQIYIVPYVTSESEARDGGARRSVHIHCKQCQTVLSLKVAWKYWEVQQIYSCMTASSRLTGC